jgi:hypothetical protein
MVSPTGPPPAIKTPVFTIVLRSIRIREGEFERAQEFERVRTGTVPFLPYQFDDV